MPDRNEYEDMHLPPVNGRQLLRLQAAVDAAKANDLKVDGYDFDSQAGWTDLRERVLRPVIPGAKAASIVSLPPDQQHAEAFRRLNDITGWLRGAAASCRLTGGRALPDLMEFAAQHAENAARSLARWLARFGQVHL